MEAVFYPNTDTLWYKDRAGAKMEISISHPAHMFVVSCHGGKGFMVYYLYSFHTLTEPSNLSNVQTQIPCDFLFLHRAELPFQAWLPFYCAKRFQWMLTCGKCSTLKTSFTVFFFFFSTCRCVICLKVICCFFLW